MIATALLQKELLEGTACGVSRRMTILGVAEVPALESACTWSCCLLAGAFSCTRAPLLSAAGPGKGPHEATVAPSMLTAMEMAIRLQSHSVDDQKSCTWGNEPVCMCSDCCQAPQGEELKQRGVNGSRIRAQHLSGTSVWLEEKRSEEELAQGR